MATVLALCLLVAVGAADPGGTTTKAAVATIHVYRATLARVWPRLGIRCRFHPTCSHYAEAAIQHYGVARGALMSAWRVLRCGPWTPAGTFDPAVPPPARTAAGRVREAPHPP